MNSTRYRAGVDIGGTFTDIVLRSDDGRVLTGKLSSTPDDYGRAIVDGLEAVCARHGVDRGAIDEIVHGTTIATNTILEGKGARTALITTRGFRDVLELRRIRIPELYNMFYDRPAPLVPRRRRFEVTERVDHRGQVRVPLAVAEVEQALAAAERSGAEAVAICLLHSYANPEHEQRIEELARARLPHGTFVSASWRVLPEIKEYERTSTTVINAYIGPAVSRYCRRLREALDHAGFAAPMRIMQSSGGILSLEEVLHLPAYIVESGPAAGVIGAAFAAERHGERNLITVDMGGTTAKASLVEDGRVARTNEYEVGSGINVSSKLVKGGGHALKLPVIDISEIGAGGGSIARVSAHGTLSVGPQSAGALPGPACYGRGGEDATLTDACVVLGYVSASYLVGGDMRIDGELSRRAIARSVAAPLGVQELEAAHGVFVLAAATMTRAVKAVSTFRGRDPRDFTLFAFGGNGPLVATEIAAALEMKRVIVPWFAGVFSAVGLLDAPIERELSRTWMKRLDQVEDGELEQRYQELERSLREAYRDAGSAGRVLLRRSAELRYYGQAFELAVDVSPALGSAASWLRRRFVDEHRRTYGHGADTDPIDLVNLRMTATLPMPLGAEVHPDMLEAGEAAPPRPAYFGRKLGRHETRVVRRGALRGGATGPLIVEETDTTVLVPPGWRASVGADASIVLERCDS